MSIRSVDTKQVTFNIYRVDSNQGWGQTLQLDYLAFERSSDLPVSGSQYGSLSVGPGRSPVVSAMIKFTTPFSGVPQLFATAQGQNYDDTFVVSVQNLTSSSAIISVSRVNGFTLPEARFIASTQVNMILDSRKWMESRPEGDLVGILCQQRFCAFISIEYIPFLSKLHVRKNSGWFFTFFISAHHHYQSSRVLDLAPHPCYSTRYSELLIRGNQMRSEN